MLKGDKFIYGVTIDDLSKQLADKVKAVKSSDFDMVPEPYQNQNFSLLLLYPLTV